MKCYEKNQARSYDKKNENKWIGLKPHELQCIHIHIERSMDVPWLTALWRQELILKII